MHSPEKAKKHLIIKIIAVVYLRFPSVVPILLDRDRLGQVSGEVNVQTLPNGKPVRNQLQRNYVQQTLETIYGLRHNDLLSLRSRKLGVILVADDDGATTAGDDCMLY